jgi:hypothetical protein
MYEGAEFNRVADSRVKVGSEITGGVPKMKSSIVGMELDYELDITQVKRFMKIKSKKSWSFRP